MTTSTITARREGDPQHYVEGKNPPTLPVERVDPSSVRPFQSSELFQTSEPQGGGLPPPFTPLGHNAARIGLSRHITSPTFFDVSFRIDF